jgi:hypothetical protein
MSTPTVDLGTLEVLLMVKLTVMVSRSNKRYASAPTPHLSPADLLAQKEEALNMWGSPAEFDAFKSVFRDFCLGKVPSLPWSEQGPSSEMKIIAGKLAQINDLGFLTINSQPAVNGVPSNDKAFGWGPSNGFVYQKASHSTIFHPLVADSSLGIP